MIVAAACKVGGVPDDDRIVAAQLERQDLVRSFGELAVQRHARASRSGEEQPSIPACPASALPSRAADQQADHAIGHARFMEAVDQDAPVAGVFSDGLNTTALPAISAGTMWPLGRCAGKL